MVKGRSERIGPAERLTPVPRPVPNSFPNLLSPVAALAALILISCSAAPRPRVGDTARQECLVNPLKANQKVFEGELVLDKVSRTEDETEMVVTIKNTTTRSFSCLWRPAFFDPVETGTEYRDDLSDWRELDLPPRGSTEIRFVVVSSFPVVEAMIFKRK